MVHESSMFPLSAILALRDSRIHIGPTVMGHLNTNNFYFILFYFSDFTLLYFYFLLKDDEEGT